MKKTLLLLFSLGGLFNLTIAQTSHRITDTNTPLYLLPPDYPMPYGPPKAEDIKATLDRIYNYLESCTPTRLINKATKAEITDYTKPDTSAIIEPGTFRLNSYEWGVTYGAMFLASEATGDPKFREYTTKRTEFLANIYPYYKTLWNNGFKTRNPFGRVIEPKALDDCGSMCNALVKTLQQTKNEKAPANN